MQMPKPTDEDKDRFRAMVDPLAGVEVKPMFGNLGAFVNGNMFAGLLGSAVGVKLGEAALTELRELPGTGPFGPGDKPMGGYAALPPDLPEDEARRWLDRARSYVATLPPKTPKTPKPRT